MEGGSINCYTRHDLPAMVKISTLIFILPSSILILISIVIIQQNFGQTVTI